MPVAPQYDAFIAATLFAAAAVLLLLGDLVVPVFQLKSIFDGSYTSYTMISSDLRDVSGCNTIKTFLFISNLCVWSGALLCALATVCSFVMSKATFYPLLSGFAFTVSAAALGFIDRVFGMPGCDNMAMLNMGRWAIGAYLITGGVAFAGAGMIFSARQIGPQIVGGGKSGWTCGMGASIATALGLLASVTHFFYFDNGLEGMSFWVTDTALDAMCTALKTSFFIGKVCSSVGPVLCFIMALLAAYGVVHPDAPLRVVRIILQVLAGLTYCACIALEVSLYVSGVCDGRKSWMSTTGDGFALALYFHIAAFVFVLVAAPSGAKEVAASAEEERNNYMFGGNVNTSQSVELLQKQSV